MRQYRAMKRQDYTQEVLGSFRKRREYGRYSMNPRKSLTQRILAKLAYWYLPR